MRASWRWLLGVLAAACSDPGSTDRPDAPGGPDAARAITDAAASDDGAAPGASHARDAADPPSPAADACTPEALREPRAAVTYYVAIEQPGADDAACDGLAPVDEGGGRCPFRDFDSERTRRLLDGVAGTRVEVRSGRYVVRGWEGLRVDGTGTSEAERVVLSAFPGEHPVFDVPAPDGAGCEAATAPDDPDCVRQVLRVSGRYTVVQGLTIQNGLGYHVEVTGGDHHLLRCNTLGETVAFAMRSDCLKLDGGARDVEVSHNDFSRFRSQAIDMTAVSNVLVADNEFHDPIDADAGATGVKHGARDVTIRGNRVHDLGGDTRAHAFALGGTGSEHPDDHAAYRVRVEGNTVWNVAGVMAQVVSCEGCALEQNDLWNAGGGIVLSGSATGRPECTTGATGCGPSQGTRIAGNRMRALDGGGDPAQANVFVFVEPGERGGLDARDNLYCAPVAADARFGLDGALVGFDAWAAGTGSEVGSHALAATDPRCAF